MMISKNEIKYIQSLYHKKARDKEKLFMVEGPKMVTELLHSSFKVHSVLTTAPEWVQKYPEAPIKQVTEVELARLSHLSTANEILAVAVQPEQKAPPVQSGGHLILVLDGIRDPGNMGTLIRIADWFGVDYIIASEDCADAFNPKVVQSTMGSLLRIPVYYVELVPYLAAHQQMLPIYGALLNGQPLGTPGIAEGITEGMLVIGNESKGIREPILPFISQAIKIPAFGQAESLNAAIAAAVLLGQLRIARVPA